MMDAYIAARELERRKAERSAELARQLPLHVEDIAYREAPEDSPARTEPDWATDY